LTDDPAEERERGEVFLAIRELARLFDIPPDQSVRIEKRDGPRGIATAHRKALRSCSRLIN
jgi:hypothetical protein